ncbi:hypothetical protein [Candidatus Burkholderia verschuerenii]|uniref:hypothetical protein n=1 Tax=Candidatus Burkholderia verschuerenii TaxID=242163 RepID=UPI00067B0453|nr:hypothetical protein [Candidatus Burkholderia verschuerenii]
MQKIERNMLAQAQISGGDGKGTSSATANSPMNIDLSGATIGGTGSTVQLEINNSATASAKA